MLLPDTQREVVPPAAGLLAHTIFRGSSKVEVDTMEHVEELTTRIDKNLLQMYSF